MIVLRFERKAREGTTGHDCAVAHRYGDIGMLAKRRIQERLVDFVKRQAEDETAQREALWQQTPATIQ